MRSFKLALVTVGAGLALGALVTACGSDETADGSGGSGGAGAAGSNSSSGPGPASASSTAASTGTTGGSGGGPVAEGVCGSELVYQSQVVNGCVTANCCTTFDPCVADADCSACLESQDPEADGCMENALFAAFDTCRDDSCPLTICGGELSNTNQDGDPLLNFHACLGAACCDTFTPCEADTECNACLIDPTLALCAENPLFTAFTTCRDASCPFDICESQIGFVTTYPDFEDAQDPNPALNKCLSDACCDEITACADPTGDGYVEMNDPEAAACLACLQEVASCAAPLKTTAQAFLDCVAAAPCD
ncbi:MAG: hypothetical protein WKG00_19570 [Polyangiaceae bacterium]